MEQRSGRRPWRRVERLVLPCAGALGKALNGLDEESFERQALALLPRRLRGEELVESGATLPASDSSQPSEGDRRADGREGREGGREGEW